MHIDGNIQSPFAIASWSTTKKAAALVFIAVGTITSAVVQRMFQEPDAPPSGTNYNVFVICGLGALAIATIFKGIQHHVRRVFNHAPEPVMNQVFPPPPALRASELVETIRSLANRSPIPEQEMEEAANQIPLVVDSMTASEAIDALTALTRYGQIYPNIRHLLIRMNALTPDMTASEIARSLTILALRMGIQARTYQSFIGELRTVLDSLVTQIPLIAHEIPLQHLYGPFTFLEIRCNEFPIAIRQRATEALIRQMTLLTTRMHQNNVASFTTALTRLVSVTYDLELEPHHFSEFISPALEALAARVPLVVKEMSRAQVSDIVAALACNNPSEKMKQAFLALATRTGSLMDDDLFDGNVKGLLQPFLDPRFNKTEAKEVIFDALASRVQKVAREMSTAEVAQSAELLRCMFASLKQPFADPIIEHRFNGAVRQLVERTLLCAEQISLAEISEVIRLFDASCLWGNSTIAQILNHVMVQAASRMGEMDITNTDQLCRTIDALATFKIGPEASKIYLDRLCRRIEARAGQLVGIHLIAESLANSGLRSPSITQAMNALTHKMLGTIRVSMKANIYEQIRLRIDDGLIARMLHDISRYVDGTVNEDVPNLDPVNIWHTLPFNAIVPLSPNNEVVRFVKALSKAEIMSDQSARLMKLVYFVISKWNGSPQASLAERRDTGLSFIDTLQAITPYISPNKISETGLRLRNLVGELGIELWNTLPTDRIITSLERTRSFIRMRTMEPGQQRALYSRMVPWMVSLARRASEDALKMSPRDAEIAVNVLAESGIESPVMAMALSTLHARAASNKRINSSRAF